VSSVRDRALALGLSARLAEVVAVHAPLGEVRRGGRAVVAVDLDRTLIYSARALGLPPDGSVAPRLAVAELYEGEPLSYLTRDAESMLEALAAAAVLVPTTTRTRAQYDRIRLLDGIPAYAITTNGGQLLVDGVPDADWAGVVAQRLASSCAPLAEVVDHLAKVSDPLWTRKRRVAEDVFAYLVVERAEMPGGFVADLDGWCAERGWTVSVQGRKVYCVPGPLTKAAAVDHVRERSGATWTLAAGDSLLDAEMLAAADEAIRPSHGELHDTVWGLGAVTVTSAAGVLGGEEIVARLLAAVLAASS
jgi:hypothetical protein